MTITAGKLMASLLVLSGVIAGAGVWYAQVYGYYDKVDPAQGAAALRITDPDGNVIPLPARDFQAIDSAALPTRYKACFATDRAELDAARIYDNPTPLVGPGWFDCYDAGALTQDLQSGAADAYLSQSNIRPGFDRVIAVYPDGRAFAWQQPNESAQEMRVLE